MRGQEAADALRVFGGDAQLAARASPGQIGDGRHALPLLRHGQHQLAFAVTKRLVHHDHFLRPLAERLEERVIAGDAQVYVAGGHAERDVAGALEEQQHVRQGG